MSTQTANPQPLSSMKRSGSINLLRGRAGSLRKRDGHKRSASNQAMPVQSQVGTAGAADDAWNSERTSLDKRPVISYAVTITAGSNSDNKKPREKRRMFERILHKRSQSRGLLPQIEEGDSPSTPKRSITPALIREGPRQARRSSRGHSRSTSALSFFHPETAQPIPEDDGPTRPWPPTFAAAQKRPGSSEESTVQKKSPMMSRYNPSQTIQRKPAPVRQISDDSTTSQASQDSKPERPKLTIITQPKDSAPALTDALQVAHPPRKSSLPGSDTLVPQEPERPSSSKDALVKSLESSAQHRRQRSKDLVNPVINVMNSIGPTPPPKDNDKGYHLQQIQQQLQSGLKVTIPDRSPLRVSEIFGEAGPRKDPLHNIKSSSRSSNNLPSPQLRRPKQSTLAMRRKAIPSTLNVMSRPRKQNVHGVLASVLSPTLTPNRVMKSRGSSRSSSKLSSPAIGKAFTTNDARTFTVVPLVPARRAPPPPLALKIPQPPPPIRPLNSLQSQSQTENTLPDPIIRAPIIPDDEKRPTPPAKSPRRLAAMKRRSMSDGHVPTVAGASAARPTHRRKSVHRRKPTGFRLTKEKEAVLRGRQADNSPAVPSLDQTAQSALANVAAAAIGKRFQSQSPPARSTGLTPPQSQGEWSESKARGRRQPSPLRSGGRSGSSDGAEGNNTSTSTRERRPDVGRLTTSISDVTTSTTTSTPTPALPSTSSSTNPPAPSHPPPPAPSRGRIPPTSTSTALRPAPTPTPTPPSIPTNSLPGNPRSTRPRAPSHTAMLPMVNPMVMAPSNPLAAHPTLAAGSTPEIKAAGRQKLVEAGHKVTPEESIKRMMERQEQQAVAMRMKLLGLGGGKARERERLVGMI